MKRRQIADFRNLAKGGECLVLTCGPSLGHLSDGELEELAEGRFVIAIKQAYLRCRKFCDLVLLNNVNNQKLEVDGSRTKVFLASAGHGRPVFERSSWSTKTVPVLSEGVHSSALPHGWDPCLAQSVAWTEAFDDYLFDRCIERPFGPGIFYEQAVYWAVHLGVSKMLVVGWDIGLPDRRIQHFDSGQSKEGGFSFQTPKPSDLPLWARSAGRLARRVIGPSLAMVQHARGRTYNRAIGGATGGELELIAAKSFEVFRWLGEHGVEMQLISNCSEADKRIPRVRVKDAARRRDFVRF